MASSCAPTREKRALLIVWWMPKSSSAPVIKRGAHVIAFDVTNLRVVLVPYPPNSEESQILLVVVVMVVVVVVRGWSVIYLWRGG